jgi:hypothetical protein
VEPTCAALTTKPGNLCRTRLGLAGDHSSEGESIMAIGDKIIYAEVVLRSRTGGSLIRDGVPSSMEELYLYRADPDNPLELRQKLEETGFTVVAHSRYGLSITGPVALFRDFFKAPVKERPVAMFAGGRARLDTTGFFIDEEPKMPRGITNLAETVYVPRRGHYLAGEGAMPATSYYALRPPNDIVQFTNADHAHNRGFRGTGVQVAMVDSGFIQNHDYYSGRGYNITVHAAVGSVTQDEAGHGTGIASNLLAIAPNCDFHFYKMDDGSNWAALAGFRMAVNGGARVITNSWGQWYDPILEAEIAAAVAAGTVVIFAAGNGAAAPGWPGSMPEVMSIGGVYRDPAGNLQASSYASSGSNPRYPTRNCPDFSALVGQSPKGIYIVVPTMTGSQFDGLFGGGVFPNGDETGPSDGWMVASGTSSAAPMVAGATALLLEAKSTLTPADVRSTFMNTCIDVVTGTTASGHAAGAGIDVATGAGMIDIGAAVDEVAPLTCPTAPIISECLRAPICQLAPIEFCARAPIQTCPRAPVECVRQPVATCARAPFEECFRAPIVDCPRAPYLPCPRAPIIECLRAPIEECVRAPLEYCVRAPLEVCPSAPSVIGCPPGPVDGCQAGPWMHPEDPWEPIRVPGIGYGAAGQRMIPITILVTEEELPQFASRMVVTGRQKAYRYARRAAQAAYQAALAEMGLADEYDAFPAMRGRRRGPFNPSMD